MSQHFNDEIEKLLEQIETLESQIESLKEDVENERERGDVQFDRAETLEEKYGHISEEDAEYLQDHCLDSMKEVYDKWLNDEIIENEYNLVLIVAPANNQ